MPIVADRGNSMIKLAVWGVVLSALVWRITIYCPHVTFEFIVRMNHTCTWVLSDPVFHCGFACFMFFMQMNFLRTNVSCDVADPRSGWFPCWVALGSVGNVLIAWGSTLNQKLHNLFQVVMGNCTSIARNVRTALQAVFDGQTGQFTSLSIVFCFVKSHRSET